MTPVSMAAFFRAAAALGLLSSIPMWPSPAVPVLEPDQVILEVKFDDFLPGHLAAALADIPKAPMAISKFAMCLNLV